MFKKLRESWRRARAENLRAEFADMMDHFNSYIIQNPGSSDEVSKGAQACYRNFTEQVGDLTALDSKQAKQVAEKMVEISRKLYKSNYGSAIGISFLAMWLEAKVLPGEDASRVVELSEGILKKLGVF